MRNRNYPKMKIFLTLFFFAIVQLGSAQLYFPPTVGNSWETTSLEELGWCEDQLPPLFDFLEASNSKGFIVLKDGKIVIEQYFGTFTADSLWYWASAGKSMTAFLVGIAQEEGLLDINQTTSSIIGEEWTSCTQEQEEQITVLNQLTMTTGLDEAAVSADCTDPECLQYLADPGTRWAYHNAPYTLLDSVLFYATGQSINSYLFNKISLATGIYGTYLPIDYNNVLFSKTRMLARFGLLCLNQGNWDGTPVLSDQAYFYNMTHMSQDLNKAYGYLWWLNGSDDYMLPGIQFQFEGPLMPDAPASTFSAMGKNGQIINVVPESNLVVIRVGNAPTNEIFFVPNVYNNDIWQYLNPVMCSNVSIDENSTSNSLRIFPNPAVSAIQIEAPGFSNLAAIELYDVSGKLIAAYPFATNLNISALSSGNYILRVSESGKSEEILFQKK